MLEAIFPKQFLVGGTDDSGLTLKQIIKAKDGNQARLKAERNGWKVATVSEQPNYFLQQLKKGQIEFSSKPASSKELAMFSRQLAQMIANNVQLTKAFEILEMSAKAKFKKVIRGIASHINEGESLAQAMASYPECFNTTYIAIVQAAEMAGQVPDALRQLAQTLQRGDKVIKKVRGALIYPTAVCCVSLVSFLIFTNVVMPKMKGLYASSKTALPVPTQILLDVSKVMRKSPLIPAGVLMLPVVIFLKRKQLMEATAVQKVAIKIPIINDLIEKTCLLRVLQLKSQFASNGVPVLRQYALIEKAAGHIRYAKAVREIKQAISAGSSESTAWADQKHLPRVISAQLAAAEQTGTTGETLREIASSYVEELDDAITSFTAILEPVLIVFLVIFIGGLVISMYLPIFDLSQALKPH